MENVWSVGKAKVKRDLTEKNFEILRTTPQGLTIKEHRLRALEQLMNNRMIEIIPGMCSNFVAQILSKVSPALSLLDMEF